MNASQTLHAELVKFCKDLKLVSYPSVFKYMRSKLGTLKKIGDGEVITPF